MFFSFRSFFFLHKDAAANEDSDGPRVYLPEGEPLELFVDHVLLADSHVHIVDTVDRCVYQKVCVTWGGVSNNHFGFSL